MKSGRLTAVLLAGLGACSGALAHGATEFPVDLDREHGCYLAGPQNPRSAACHAGDRLTDPAALKAVQHKRVYVGYYPTWSDNGFSAAGKTANEVFRDSKFARVPANYTHVMASFAKPDFSWAGLAANSWSGTGLDFTATPQDIKAAIDVLHQRNIKVILAVGGATYNNWDALAAEGAAGGGPITNALAQIQRDLGFDGLDNDYELADAEMLANATKALRNAVNLAGGRRTLSLAAWSTGADCTAATSADPACAGKVSYWGGAAGRERLLKMNYPVVAGMFDLVNIMAYDARFEHYDGVVAYNQYRALFPARTIVSIGLQPAPEGWAGGQLVVNNADAQCTGSVILQDQYSNNLDLPYSVERYTGAVLATSPLENPRDGAMLWSILKSATGSCGSAALASPGTIGKRVANSFGLTDDPALQSEEFR